MSEEANGAAGLVAEIERLRTDNAELRASAELTHRQWRSMVAERAGLRAQLAAAECAYALAASRAAAALAWLEVRGPLLPAAWRDELKEALHARARRPHCC
jgi:hypothetical protein